MSSNPVLIGIAGGSCSGKTTFAKWLYERIGSDNCELLWQDNYYIDQSHHFDHDGGAVNFDHPDAIDFELMLEHLSALKNNGKVSCPTYDFSTHTRTSTTIDVNPKSIILIDGILIFHHPALREIFDYRYYISASEKVRFERRLNRDVRERGRTEEGVHEQFFKQVAPMHNQFVSPTKSCAHRIITEKTFESEKSSVVEEILKSHF